MPGSLIAATYARDLTPLSASGQPVAQAWAQLDAYLRRARGPQHADLFAEPNFDPESGRTDWYATVEGTPQALDALDGPARAAAVAQLDTLRRDIEAEAAALAAGNRPADAALAELLRLALRIPATEYVRIVGKQPVLFGWGHEQGGRSVTPEALVRLVAAPPPPPAPVGPAAAPAIVTLAAAAPRRGIWRWLLAALLALLLLLALLVLLFDPFGWFRAPPIACVVPRDETALLEEQRTLQRSEEALRNELARLRQELGNRRLACPAPEAPAPRPQQRAEQTPPPAPTPSQDVQRAERERAQTGRMQIILAWDDTNDLDLSVRCPNGALISFNSRRACGGVLDVDANSPDGPHSRTPVENVAWTSEPPPGRYTVHVTHYARQGGPASSEFRVTVRITGQPDRVYRGRVAENQTNQVTVIDWPPAGSPR